MDSKGKILKPSIHDKVGYGPGDEISEYYPFQELLGKEEHDVLHRSTQYFANSDLFNSLLGGEQGQTEKPQTCNEDG